VDFEMRWEDSGQNVQIPHHAILNEFVGEERFHAAGAVSLDARNAVENMSEVKEIVLQRGTAS
jgi:hypothetical protein